MAAVWRGAHSVPATSAKVPMHHLMAVHDAAMEQDLPALSKALEGLTAVVGLEKAQALLRSEILPQLCLKDLLWLWRSITSPVEQHKILSKMADGTTSRLSKSGFVLGKDFSFSLTDEGDQRLMLSSDAKKYLELTLRTDSLVTLALLTRHKHVL